MSETIVLEKDRMIDPSVEERWDGANGNVEKFDVKVQAELLSRGGRSYMRFYTGDYSSEAFEKFLRSIFSGVWHQPKLKDANFDEPTADGSVLYPPRYLEFVKHFLDGATAKFGCLQNGDGSFNAFADYATDRTRISPSHSTRI